MKDKMNETGILHTLQRRQIFTPGISFRPHWLVRFYGWTRRGKNDDVKKAFVESKTACLVAAESKASAWYEEKIGPLKIRSAKLEAIASATTNDERGVALAASCKKQAGELQELLVSCRTIIEHKAEARAKRAEAFIDAFCQGADYKH